MRIALADFHRPLVTTYLNLVTEVNSLTAESHNNVIQMLPSDDLPLNSLWPPKNSVFMLPLEVFAQSPSLKNFNILSIRSFFLSALIALRPEES